MINITEDGQYYSAYDHTVHQDARPFYVDNWLWDTYRALEPLHTLLNPEMEADKLQSYVRMYEQLGWMPSFAVLYGNHPCMTGNHAAAWMADAWYKGVRDFNLKSAYAGVRKNSLEGTWLPWRKGPKCSLDDFLTEHGYLPALRPGEKETVTAGPPPRTASGGGGDFGPELRRLVRRPTGPRARQSCGLPALPDAGR